MVKGTLFARSLVRRNRNLEMRLLILTPLPSPFVHQAFERLQTIYPDLKVQAVFYGDLSHRPSWGELGWQGEWLKGSLRERIKQLSALVEEERPHQIVLGQYNRIESWWLKRYAKRNGLPMHLIFLEPLIPTSRWRYRIKLELFRRFLSGVSSVGYMGRRAFSDYSSIYKGDLFDCPYSFDLSSMFKFNRDRAEKGKVTFLYSGRLSAFRDPLLALRVFYKVYKIAGPKVNLVISGSGELQAEVEAQIEEYDLGSQVSWMNDFKDWEDLRNLYRHADVLLSLGIYNTWSLTIQEAMAAGLGIVATHTTEAANQLIVNGHNGYLVDHDNEDAIARAMLRYVDEKDLVKLHGIRSREVVKSVDLVTVSENLSRAFCL